MSGDNGPFQTEREASGTKAVQAVYAAFDADPGPGKMRPHNVAMLTAACAEAGVALGAFDARQLEWLGTWEPHTCAVIAGLITRAHEAGKALRPSGAAVAYDLADPDARHALTTALDDYAAKERDMAAGEGGNESRERWADLADQMRQQAEAAGW